MSFATSLTEVSSQKHLLFEVEPSEELWNWSATGGQSNTYEIAWNHLAATDIIKGGLYRRLISVEEDGTALSETDSIAKVEANAGYYYHDEAAGKIYVQTTGTADPDTLDMIAAIFRIHFSTNGSTFSKNAGVNAQDFDGATDWYTKASDLSGVSDGTKFVLSTWFRIRNADGAGGSLLGGTGSSFNLNRDADDKIFLSLHDASDNIVLHYVSKTRYLASDAPDWFHIYISVDTSIPAYCMYINGVDDMSTQPPGGTNYIFNEAAGNIDFTPGTWGLATNAAANNEIDGDLSEFYFAPGQYLNAEGRFKFRDVNGEPVGLGSTGELPTGTAPAIYAPGGDASANLGTGGNFTEAGSPAVIAGPAIRERHINYEKRILAGTRANVSEKAVDLIIGKQKTTTGVIALDNTDSLFDKLSRAWNWKNKSARYRFGIDDIEFFEYQTTGRLIVDDIAPLEESFTLSLVADIDAWRQRFPIAPHFGTVLGEGVIGTRIPVLLGRKNNTLPDLVDDEDNAANEWIYRIADNTYQTLYGVLAVYAINKSNGSWTTLTLNVDYTVDLTNCAITVNDTFDGGAEIEEKYEIRCSAQGQPAGSSDTSTDFLKYPGEIARYILTTFLEYTDADLDLDSFSAADANAPFILGFWIKEETTIRDVLRGIERSVLGAIRPKDNGTIEFFIWDPWSGDADATELGDEDFSKFETDVKMSTVYYKTDVLYNENLLNPGSFEIETVTHNPTKYLNDSIHRLSIETYLKSSSDAQLIAQRINFLYRGINIEIDFTERGIQMIDHELYQRVKVTKTRASSTAGSFTSRLMELVEIDKDFVTPRVSGRLGDLRGLSNVIGKWTEAGVPTWSNATDEEKAAAGYWTDANGLADASDLASAGKSRWW